MSNNKNLSKLANVLDDGSSGQYLKSTGSSGVVFDTVAAGQGPDSATGYVFNV